MQEDDNARAESTVREDPTGYEKILEDLLGEEDGRPILKGQVGVPGLTEGQIRKSVMVIPAGYWNLNCWTCCKDGN